MIGFLGCHSRKVCSLLPVSGVIIVVDPVTKGPAAWRAFPDDDDAVAIGVGFEFGGYDAYVTQVIPQASVAEGDDRERQGVELIFR
jgi:hypothetical protein